MQKSFKNIDEKTDPEVGLAFSPQHGFIADIEKGFSHTLLFPKTKSSVLKLSINYK
jgi:hypothetical protein